MEKLSEEDAMNKYFDGSLTIRYAQKNQPWTVPYAEWTRREQSPSGFRCIFMGRHALLHAMKSVGKIAAEFEAVEHEDDGSTHGRTLSDAAIRRVADMAADLVTAALRLANVFNFDLESALIRRVREKNGVGYGKAE